MEEKQTVKGKEIIKQRTAAKGRNNPVEKNIQGKARNKGERKRKGQK